MSHLRAALLIGALILPTTGGAQPGEATCCDPARVDSPKVGGNYGNQSYSALDGIRLDNVARLGGAWLLNIENGDDSAFQQSNVVAVDGVLYAETTQGSVVAVDGATGVVKWRYRPEGGPLLRRGVAVGEGRVYTLKSGNRVVALDQNTGAVVWQKDYAAERTLGSMPTAVTYYDGMILFGTANSQRGAAFALNAATGEEIWRFYGAPATGEFGSDTWAGETWKQGGAAPWLHPAIDPQLGIVYYTFGNARAGAPLDGSTREGQNLFANSIVAIEAKTGKRLWHFQSVHHDIWDLDNVMAPVLLDLEIAGRKREAVMYGSKTGLLYFLDRRTGEAIHPIEERPVPQEPRQKTWPTQPFPVNEPLVELCPTGEGAMRPPPNYQSGCLYTPHWDDPVVKYPGIGGGADTSQYSYSHKTGLLYVGVGLVGSAQARTGSLVGFRPLGQERSGRVVAYDPVKGAIAWEKPMEWSLAHGNGVLSTAGDVMFIGQPDGYLLALDARDGRELWRFQTGAGVHTSPMTYQVRGEQYVAVLAGGNGLPYNSPKGDHLWAFKIDGKVPPAPAPAPPPKRQPITATVVDGSATGNVVHLGRLWSGSGPAAVESSDQNAMAPQAIRVKAGEAVTFLNPPDNNQARCATQFYEGLFDSKPLKPGERFSYVFTTPGEYFYHDCASPGTTGKVLVQ